MMQWPPRLIPDARVLVGPAATEHAVKTVNGPRVLHIATHGFFLNAASSTPTNAAGAERGGVALAAVDPQSLGRQALLRSGLALAGANQRQGGDGEDGLLTALEAASLDLARHERLYREEREHDRVDGAVDQLPRHRSDGRRDLDRGWRDPHRVSRRERPGC